ncbi:hypothetical protein BHE74_00003090 [Ensete ventricosum]|uniref:Uncharacterized protein n=1 Tax=Ensete ventricosum TaxID=4639 RepID=A0A427B3N3_ENSVE|nr:hypothetical protein B296_00001931 [Ensete ventricosum]RWW21928.1 hypothetical protein GW17_00013887 [Ensete ventricosum]RWW88047.1 hypothetical protein BHE74_00003090 [Ensete ventricosum]RZR75729.1 hypothetical protein BHM03_00000209 [Ensete ventricosum]
MEELYPKNHPSYPRQDHERAYFDSADWALGKQGGHAHKPKGPLEALRPKLQPTQQQARSRRSVYASTENEGITCLFAFVVASSFFSCNLISF